MLANPPAARVLLTLPLLLLSALPLPLLLLSLFKLAQLSLLLTSLLLLIVVSCPQALLAVEVHLRSGSSDRSKLSSLCSASP